MTAAAVGKPAKRYTTLNPEPLARTLVVWIYLYIGLTAATALASLYRITAVAALEAGGGADTSGLETADVAVQLTAIAYFLCFLVEGFLALKWIYRSARNAHAVARGLEVSPPWAVGFYFVPLANLIMPFKAMRETWQASHAAGSWRSVPTPPLLYWWWGTWLVSGVIENIAGRISWSAETLDMVLASDWLTLAAAPLSAASAVLFVRIVQRVTRAQAQALHAAEVFA